MKRNILFYTVFFLFLLSSTVSAHPGNTDGSGGHTCRTNCDDWGLYYGEYHYHDGNGGTYNLPAPQEDYDNGYSQGYDTAYGYTSNCEEEYDWYWEGTDDFGRGFEDGIDDGHEEGLELCEQNSLDAGYSDGEDDSYIGLEYDEYRNYSDEYQFEAYSEGYYDGYDTEVYTENQETETEVIQETAASVKSAESGSEASDPSLRWIGFASVMGFAAVVLSISTYIDRKKRKANN
ncbi:YHYH domain-containing protein [Bacillus sp. EB01]|uniref:YHYH domain-containing protein n=1 Tax=Bacillus sp. EB01 TaxID=1347086 RepID=UPI0005C6D65B|nr:YHYH domain-containing protein [Bacillus sp. EB01]